MTTTSLTVTPLSNRIGAQIDGVDLTDLDGAEFTAIDEALMRYQVVFLRGQELTPESQAAFAGRWGPLSVFPVAKMMGRDTTMSVIEDTVESPPATDTWHTDVTWIAEPPRIAVLYGDITFHHAVVLDVSGSMTYPTNAKLDAAKQAAKFYIDAVKDNDRFTVVSFSGDGSECNTDATNLKGAAGMFPGTLANRTAMKNAVQALAPQNLTSIGDGLWIAQDALDNDATPGSIDTILLLTDGKENEARFWDQNPAPGCGRVDTRILADETIVNTRAFGENAETDLCQQIAAQTGGDYLFNPVDEAFAASLRAATTDFQELNNQLTLRFFAGLEHSAKLQRIALERGQLGGTQSILIGLNQPNDEVSQSLIYVGWSEATGVKVSIKTPPPKRTALPSNSSQAFPANPATPWIFSARFPR